MDDEAARIVISELRKIRDGVEVIASAMMTLVMGLIIFSGALYPRPEGLAAWGGAVICLLVGGSVAKGIRSR